MLDERRVPPEPAIGLDRQAGHASAAVIGHQHVLALPIDDQVAGTRADRRLLVQRRQPAARRIDRERADSTASPALEFAHLVHRVQELPARVNGQERRIDRRGGESRLSSTSPIAGPAPSDRFPGFCPGRCRPCRYRRKPRIPPAGRRHQTNLVPGLRSTNRARPGMTRSVRRPAASPRTRCRNVAPHRNAPPLQESIASSPCWTTLRP